MTMALTAPPASARIHRCDKHPEKMQYRTTDAAFDVAERRAPQEGVPIFVYACDHCGYFHLSKKRGTENIGRLLLSRQDGVLWSSSTANPHNPLPERDLRFLDTSRSAPTRQAIVDAVRKHGSPESVSMTELREWTGIADKGALRTAIYNLGWVGHGTTRTRRYYRSADLVPQVDGAPPVAPPVAPAAATPPEAPRANHSGRRSRLANRRLITKAIREHGGPDSVTMAELREWTGIESNGVLRGALESMGWRGEGTTTRRRYYRPGYQEQPGPLGAVAAGIAADAASALGADSPGADSPGAGAGAGAGAWRIVSAADFVTAEALRVLAAAQVEIEIRVRTLV